MLEKKPEDLTPADTNRLMRVPALAQAREEWGRQMQDAIRAELGKLPEASKVPEVIDSVVFSVMRSKSGPVRAAFEQFRKIAATLKSTERAGREAALAAGIAALPEQERLFAEEPEQRADLLGRLSLAHEAIPARLFQHPHPQGDAFAGEVDLLAQGGSPDSKLIRDGLSRLWQGARDLGALVPEAPTYRDALDLDFGHVPLDLLAEVEALSVWPAVRDGWRRDRAPTLAARVVLADNENADPKADAALRHALEERLEHARIAGAWNPPASDAEEDSREADGMHASEAARALFLESLGQEGDALRKLALERAEELREAARERWAKWRSPPLTGVSRDDPPWRDVLRFPRYLARLLWEGEVRERLERERRTPPGLTHGVITRIEGAIRPNLVVEEVNAQRLLFDRNGTAVAIFRRATPLGIPSLTADNLDALIARAPQLLASLDFQRALFWLVTAAHGQWLGEAADFRRLVVEGGWSALPNLAGGGKAEDLKRTIMAMAHLCWTWPDGTEGNLLSYTERKGHRGQRARVTITLGDVLLPGYVHALDGKSLRARQDRRLVPLITRVPFVGRERDHGAQGALLLRLLADMRVHAAELVGEHGGVRWTAAEIAAHGQAVGLAPAVAQRAFARWLKDGDDFPAVFLRAKPDRYTLGPAHAEARDFMAEGGRAELAGAKGGALRAAKKRASYRRSKGKKGPPVNSGKVPPLTRERSPR